MKLTLAILSLVFISSTGHALNANENAPCAQQAKYEASLFMANEIKVNATYIGVKSIQYRTQSDSMIKYSVLLFNNVTLDVSLNKDDCSRKLVEFTSID
jgi:hypothetical protein